MSKIALSPNASGAGTLTIAAPNTNSDRTLTLPDAAGTVFVSGQALSATTGTFSGNVTLGSSVLATPTGSAPSYTCRAWVNFNGTGTVAIRASGNVSSITDNGTGDYTVNFTTAMPDANYAPLRTINHADPQGGFYVLGDQMSQTTTAFRFKTGYVTSFSAAGVTFDLPNIYVAIFR